MTNDQLIKQYTEHTANINAFGLHLKCIGNNIVDVFSGEGFERPTRLRKVKGQWSHQSGPKLGNAEQVAVVTALS